MKIWKGTLLHSTDSEKALLRLVQTILADPDNPSVPQLKAEINLLVYALYNISPQEIEMSIGKKESFFGGGRNVLVVIFEDF